MLSPLSKALRVLNSTVSSEYVCTAVSALGDKLIAIVGMFASAIPHEFIFLLDEMIWWCWGFLCKWFPSSSCFICLRSKNRISLQLQAWPQRDTGQYEEVDETSEDEIVLLWIKRLLGMWEFFMCAADNGWSSQRAVQELFLVVSGLFFLISQLACYRKSCSSNLVLKHRIGGRTL